MVAAAPNAPAVAVRKNRKRLFDATPRLHATSTPSARAGQEVPSPDAALALRPREGGGDGNGERVDDGLLVHAVELRVVDLEGVAHGGPGRGEARAVRPHPCLVAGARQTLGLDEVPGPGPGASRRPHSQGVEEERAGRGRGERRNIVAAGFRDVLGKPPDGIPFAHDRRRCAAGAFIDVPICATHTGCNSPARLQAPSRNGPSSMLSRSSGSMLAGHRAGRIDINRGVRWPRRGRRPGQRRNGALSSRQGVALGWTEECRSGLEHRWHTPDTLRGSRRRRRSLRRAPLREPGPRPRRRPTGECPDVHAMSDQDHGFPLSRGRAAVAGARRSSRSVVPLNPRTRATSALRARPFGVHRGEPRQFRLRQQAGHPPVHGHPAGSAS